MWMCCDDEIMWCDDGNMWCDDGNMWLVQVERGNETVEGRVEVVCF